MKEPQRRLSRHDSKYAQYQSLPIATNPNEEDTVDNLPLPPTPTVQHEQQAYRYESLPERTARTSSASISSSSSTTRRSHQINGGGDSSPKTPIVQTPPSIDRHSKPSRMPRDGYHTYNANRRPSASDSIERRAHIRDMKMVCCLVHNAMLCSLSQKMKTFYYHFHTFQCQI